MNRESWQPEVAYLRAALLMLSIAMLGHALQIGDGILKPGAIGWLIGSLATCVVAVLAPMPRVDLRFATRLAILAAAACVVWQVHQLFERPPFNDFDPAASALRFFRIMLSIACALALILVATPASISRYVFPILLIAYLVLGAWVIRNAPPTNDRIFDIVIFQRDAASALLHGTNPYTITFPDIHGPAWYAPDVSVGGRLQFGYPYMPLTLLLTLPGHLLAGDFRYSHLVAIVLAAALLAYARPSRLSFIAATLLLLQPRGLYIIERGWSDPQVILMLALTLFTAIRAPRYLPLALGLLIVSKQYMLAAIGAMPLLVPQWNFKSLGAVAGEAGIVAFVASAPLALLAPTGFWRSAVSLQFLQPYRWDSLSLVAWMGAGARLSPTPWWLAFVALAVVLALCLWRCPRTVAGFAAAIAVSYFCFFAFGKQAFANYYHVVIAAMCGCVATAADTLPEV